MTTTENVIKSQIRKHLGCVDGLVLFTNPVGTGKLFANNGDARRVAFGLCKGSSDLIGWRTRTITLADVGRDIAQFVALEIKTARGKPTAEQLNFIRAVNQAGGLGAIVRSPEEARELLEL